MCSYAGLLIGSIAFITQLMSTYGAFNGINLAVWHLGVGLGGMLIGSVASLLRWWAYDSAWAAAYDRSELDFQRFYAVLITPLIKSSIIENIALSTSAGLILYS